MSHTYTILPVSQATYAEIREKLLAADYIHAIHGTLDSMDECIDMHGIAVQQEKE
jgi:hypothetical protein